MRALSIDESQQIHGGYNVKDTVEVCVMAAIAIGTGIASAYLFVEEALNSPTCKQHTFSCAQEVISAGAYGAFMGASLGLIALGVPFLALVS